MGAGAPFVSIPAVHKAADADNLDRFAAESRVVELSGEGFFEVVSDPDWPLYVKTPKGVTVKPMENHRKAAERAIDMLDETSALVVCGSLYLASAMLPVMKELIDSRKN